LIDFVDILKIIARFAFSSFFLKKRIDIKCYLTSMHIINVNLEHSFPKVTRSADNKNITDVFLEFIGSWLHSEGN